MTFAIAPNLAGDFGVYDALGNALTGEVDVLLEELPVVVRLKGRVRQKLGPDGLEEFRWRLRRGMIDVARLLAVTQVLVPILRRRESSAERASTGPSATAENPSV